MFEFWWLDQLSNEETDEHDIFVTNNALQAPWQGLLHSGLFPSREFHSIPFATLHGNGKSDSAMRL